MTPSSFAPDLLDLFLPRGCLACRGRIPPEDPSGLVCNRCLTLLRPPPPPRCARCDAPLGTGKTAAGPCLECSDWPLILRSTRAAYVMETPADTLVHAFKYEGWRTLGNLMGHRMSRLHRDPGKCELIVPVPTTPRRRRIRGYNQAQILAEVVGRILGIPVLAALERAKGGTQVSLGPWERRSNVMGAFQVPSTCRSRIRGSEVILIDDVMTTGATAVSAALALGEKGAKSVRLLTFARALPFGGEETRDPIA